MKNEKGVTALAILGPIAGIFILCAVIALGMWGCPVYNVWQQGLAGEAKLARAEQERQIVIKRAKAEEEAAEHTAAAIKIVGAVAQQYPEYRTQEFIGAFADAMSNGDIDKVIYVPTEANIPIIEVSRLLEYSD